jgi:hypothetical protein
MRRNGDEDLREFERAAAAGDASARIRLLAERLRRGKITEDAARIAAQLGDPAALALLPSLRSWSGMLPLPLNWSDPWAVTLLIDRIAALVSPRSPARVVTAYACDMAERALPMFEAAYPGDIRLRTAIAAARNYYATRQLMLRPTNARRLAAEAVEMASQAERAYHAALPHGRPSILHPYFLPPAEAARAGFLAVHTTMNSQRASAVTPLVGPGSAWNDYRSSTKAYFAGRHSAQAVCGGLAVEGGHLRPDELAACYAREREWQMQRLAQYALGDLEVPRPMRRNSDEDLRSLERRAAAGDAVASRQARELRIRLGQARPSDLILEQLPEEARIAFDNDEDWPRGRNTPDFTPSFAPGEPCELDPIWEPEGPGTPPEFYRRYYAEAYEVESSRHTYKGRPAVIGMTWVYCETNGVWDLIDLDEQRDVDEMTVEELYAAAPSGRPRRPETRWLDRAMWMRSWEPYDEYVLDTGVDPLGAYGLPDPDDRPWARQAERQELARCRLRALFYSSTTPEQYFALVGEQGLRWCRERPLQWHYS